MSTNLCVNCQPEKETVMHLFIHCVEAQNLWRKIREYLLCTYDLHVNLTLKQIMLKDSDDSMPTCIDLIILITKEKLYANKCLKRKTNIHEIVNEYEFIHELERKKVQTIQEVKRYNMKWPDNVHVELERKQCNIRT